VSHAMQLTSVSCPHELRPGTTVCLHCRWEARRAVRARRRRALLRGSTVLAVVSTLGTVGLVGRFAMQGRSFVPRLRVAAAAITDAGGDAAVPKTAPAPTSAPSQQGSALATATASAAPAAPVAGVVPVAPVVPQGQTPLADSLLATRADSVVTVWFDRTMIRTRNPVKFERLVRSTLPALYGAVADSALKRIPEGAFAQQGDLINELPTRGLRIPLAPGWMFALFPITRPGHDGPLVTQYRVSVIRG
jgi:hypothetical protein